VERLPEKLYSARYGLFGERIFADFKPNFLKKNIP
jgi:hypothetical protein